MILGLFGALQLLLALRVIFGVSSEPPAVAVLKSQMSLGASRSASSFRFLTKQRASKLVLNVSWLKQKQLKKFW